MTIPAVEVAEIGFKNNKSSSQAGILSDVRDVYNHGATLTSVAGDVHYHNYAPGENGLVRREESSASYNQPELPSQLYSRLLMGEGRGYPLMDAKLPNELPEEYRLHGVMIGDVGIVTQDGYFDVLFNICEPADGSINGGYVPEGFVRLERPPDNRHNYRRDQAYEAGAWAIRGDIRVASHPLLPGNSSDEYQFACGSEQGGILVLPSGASKEDLINRKTFLEYASKHGASWYEFANDRLGRDIANGSIYLITGYDKTSTWGAASFFANSTIPRFRMRFTGTRWDEPGRAFVKQVRHPQEYTTLPENQCIFLRGYKVTLSNHILAKIFGTTVVQTSPMDRIMEEQDRWSIFNLFHVGTELAFVFRNAVSGRSTTTGNARLEIPEPDHLILTPTVSPLSSDIHPSNLVNLYLLGKFPGSDIAVTHDYVWCSYLEAQDRNETNSSYSLFEYIDSKYASIQKNNAVYLVDFPDPEILAAEIEGGIEDKSCTSDDELSPTNIDLADEGTRAHTDTMTSSLASDQPFPMRTAAHSEHGGHVISMAEYRISKSTGAPAPKRASLRLREAIQELEEGGAGEASVSNSNSIPKEGLERGSPTLERKTFKLLIDASDHDIPKSISPDPPISAPSSLASEVSTASSATHVDSHSRRPNSKASFMKFGTFIGSQPSPSIQIESPSPTAASFVISADDKKSTALKNTSRPHDLSHPSVGRQSADLDPDHSALPLTFLSMGGLFSATGRLFGACAKKENPAVEAIDRSIEERERKEREEHKRKEGEERERTEREEREQERERLRREMEAREEKLQNEMAAKEAEIKRSAENKAAMRKEHEKKEADLMNDFEAKAAAIQQGFTEHLATLQREREAMEARMKREREDEEKKAMHAQEDLQKLQSEHGRLQAEKDNIEENWKAGIRPIERITKEEFLAVKQRYGYQKNMFHIAITGMSGAGKSSLLNAFLGLSNKDSRAARTGIVECTNKVARYPGEPPVVWYDMPGAGTFDKPGWQYFNQQGLYIFDCIIVLWNIRFTETDAAILQNCLLVDPPIPTFIVQSKSDQYIDTEYQLRTEDEDDLDAVAEAEIMQECIDHYVEGTKTNVRENLQKIGLDENQRVYLVSQASIRAIVRKLKSGEFVDNLVTGGGARRRAPVLDENDLIDAILSTGRERRG